MMAYDLFTLYVHLLSPPLSLSFSSGAGDLTTLMYRMQHHKVPLWSRIGRLKRNNIPKLTGGGQNFGGGASQGEINPNS